MGLLYQQHGVWFKDATLAQALTPKQFLSQNIGKLKAFTKILDLTRKGAVIVYADGAVFTSSTQAIKTWMSRNSSFKIKKVAKLSFDAVAALAGMDWDGRLVE